MKKIKINVKDICNYEINLLYNSDIFTTMTRELINFNLKDWKKTTNTFIFTSF